MTARGASVSGGGCALTRRRVLLAGLLLLAAVVRIVWIVQPRIVWGDEPFYLWLGDSLVRGQGYQFFGISGVHFSPLFPLLTGALARIMPAAEPLAAASNVLYVVFGTLLVLPVYGYARRLIGPAAAAAAGLLTAVYPALTSGIPLWGTMTEPLYLLLVASAWWALYVALEESKPWAYALAGLFLGLSYLTRTEAIVYVAAGLGATALITVGWQRKSGVRKLARGLACALGVFFVVISPYLIVLHGITGKWQLAEEAGSTYVSARGLALGDVAAFDQATWGLDPASSEVYLFSPASEGQGLLDAIRSDLRGFLRLVRRNVADVGATLISPRLLSWYLLPIIALGLFVHAWNAQRLRGELLLLAALAGPLSFLPFFIQDRYIAGALLPALIWAGGGIAWLGEWLAKSVGAWLSRPRPAIASLLRIAPLLLLALLLLWQGPRLQAILRNTGSFQEGHVAIAARLREAGATAETLVMTRYPAIAFHAGTRWTPTPAAAWDDVLGYARRKGVAYLAVDTNEAKLRPQLAFLLDGEEAASFAPELVPVTTVDAGRGPIVLYEFR